MYHRTMNENGEYDCHVSELISMPNWRYSYALALYKLSLFASNDEDEDAMKVKATEALVSAIRCNPHIPQLLLDKNKVNITGRSFQTDWPSVLSPLRELNEDLTTQQSILAGSLARDYEGAKRKVVSVFIERSYKLWCGDDTSL